ncbi:MAG: hypothetical protein DRI22_03200 [Caldiserica bacterium]|nr:MAG: hypothetical protein DRI22_03200 [Caldisericota bacterium]
MHELGIAKEIFKEIKRVSGGKKPKEVFIVIGKGTGIEKDFLKHSLKEHIFKEIGWDDVEVIFEEEEVLLYCRNCDREINEIESFSCPFCGGFDLEILKGNRTYVKKVQ